MHQAILQKPAATVNAGIPKSSALRNLEMNRPAVQSQPQQRPAPVAQPVVQPAPAAQAAAPRRAEAEVVPMEVMEEIRSLRKIVEQHLAGFAWGEVARSEPVKTDILRQMLDAGFSPQFARDLLSDLPQEMSNVEAMAWVKGAADRSLTTIGVKTILSIEAVSMPWSAPPGWVKRPRPPSWPLVAYCVMDRARWPW